MNQMPNGSISRDVTNDYVENDQIVSHQQIKDNQNQFEFVQIDDCQKSIEDQENTPEQNQAQMPNLLGNYDCGDEPEEEDDSVNDQNDDESGESENDDISQIKQDDFSSPKKENELNPYNDDLEPELKMDGEKN